MRRSEGKTPTRAPSPLARGPEAARRSLQQARPDLVRAAWGPRARLAVGGWRERSRSGACTRTPPHLSGRSRRPAPLGLAGPGPGPGFSRRRRVGERQRAPRPRPLPATAAGGGGGLLICSGGEERETRRERATSGVRAGARGQRGGYQTRVPERGQGETAKEGGPESERERTGMGTEGGGERGREEGAERGGPQTAEPSRLSGAGKGVRAEPRRLGGRAQGKTSGT